MNARLYKTDDHAMLSQWWTGHGGAAVPQSLLPEVGVIVNNGTDDLAAAFIYFDSSRPIAFAAWFVTSPEATPKQASAALDYLLGAMEKVAKEHHGAVLIPMAEKPSLKKWFLSHGYALGCDNGAIFIKQI